MVQKMDFTFLPPADLVSSFFFFFFFFFFVCESKKKALPHTLPLRVCCRKTTLAQKTMRSDGKGHGGGTTSGGYGGDLSSKAQVGVLAASNGSVYEGEFKDGKKDGCGVFSYENGNSYKGQFQNGHKDGMGRFLWSKGDAYEGRFLQDRRTGLLPQFPLSSFPLSLFYSILKDFCCCVALTHFFPLRLWIFPMGEWKLVLRRVEG